MSSQLHNENVAKELMPCLSLHPLAAQMAIVFIGPQFNHLRIHKNTNTFLFRFHLSPIWNLLAFSMPKKKKSTTTGKRTFIYIKLNYLFYHFNICLHKRAHPLIGYFIIIAERESQTSLSPLFERSHRESRERRKRNDTRNEKKSLVKLQRKMSTTTQEVSIRLPFTIS